MDIYWSQYWQQGYLTSFGDSIKANYQGVIKDCWFRFFDNLTAQDKVIDIGTGNGALIALAQAHPSLRCKFVGIDYASLKISDKSLIERENVEFFSNVNAENLAFESGEFTTAIAQFSLEYTDIEQSIKEISRVLVAGGRFQFVCHHVDSLILKPNDRLLDAALKIKEKEGVFDTLKKLVQALGQKGTPKKATTEKLRNKLNNLVSGFLDTDDDAFQNTGFPTLIRTVFSQKNIAHRQVMISEFEEKLYGQISRLTQFSEAALNKEDKENLLHFCQQAKLNIENNDIIYQEDGQILGYVFSGYKR